ncbi:hypothetical protein FQR65_LT11349 [Abscondita terminalis]|nr:hypothetical protein FQR65_LT11349 [Abscondita terminalis]
MIFSKIFSANFFNSECWVGWLEGICLLAVGDHPRWCVLLKKCNYPKVTDMQEEDVLLQHPITNLVPLYRQDLNSEISCKLSFTYISGVTVLF